MKILIATGIYPPQIGGPAQYAKNIAEIWTRGGHEVSVKTYTIEHSLPTGIRHICYFLRIIPSIINSDFVFALDTFSVGFPAVLASKIFGKKIIIRTGGDFLWEGFVERTGKKVLLRNFYNTEKENFNFKERMIFKVTKWTLKNTSKLVFSTEWQRDIFVRAYDLDSSRTSIIENFYGPKEDGVKYKNKIFVGSSRNLSWKNLDILKEVFSEITSAELFLSNLNYDDFMNKIKESYAVIQVSLGDISPNLILDAIRLGKPFICTKEVGIFNRIKDAGAFVDPLNKDEIKKAVIDLLDEDNYRKAVEKVRQFSYTHTWQEIGNEFLNIYNSIK